MPDALTTHRNNTFVGLADRRARFLWANQFPDEPDVWYYKRPFFEDVHPDDVDQVKVAFAKCVIEGQTVDFVAKAVLYEQAKEQTEKRYRKFQVRLYPCDIEATPYIAAVMVNHVIPDGVEFNETDMNVLKGLMDDKTIKEIADQMEKSQSTIETRIKGLKDKLGVETLPGLVASAMRSYLV
jgi:DNA-binding CsgD family transcriptional regulator